MEICFIIINDDLTMSLFGQAKGSIMIDAIMRGVGAVIALAIFYSSWYLSYKAVERKRKGNDRKSKLVRKD